MKRVFGNVSRWMWRRVVHIPHRDNRISVWLMFFLWLAATFTVTLHAIGNPTGASVSSRMWDISKFIGLNSVSFLIAAFLLGAFFSFLYIPLPRLCFAGFLYTSAVNIVVLRVASSGTLFSYAIGFGFSIAALLIGLIFAVTMHRKAGRISVLAVVMVTAVGSSLYFVLADNTPEAVQVDAPADAIPEENPGTEGNHDYTFFTYGSGDDVQREAFGQDVDEITPTVDASDWITTWGEKKRSFWEFGPDNLPINGRAWLPEGDGPFPVMLMVHGNHTMEKFSTDGYDYLGELLASRGFIAISVDEDFVNYSNVSGSPNDNYKLRAWLILKHLEQLQAMNNTSESVFHEKIDLDQVALMGHSRGGQAALMAADYETYFDDAAFSETMENVNIEGVVNLAPTDKTIDGEKPHLHNTSYLFLGGAHDADVSDFRGDRQYYRTTFDPSDDGFKSTLYIADANHTQFNSSWGQMDLSLPRGLFLEQSQTMAPEEQREMTKVYMGAFMEHIFHDQHAYTDLFKDYRYGNEWLPDSALVNKYQDAEYMPLVTFDDDENERHEEMEGFQNADVEMPEDRAGNDRLAEALQLEWNEDARYSLELGSYHLQTRMEETPDEIVFTMANNNAENGETRAPDIDIELETTDGDTALMPLDELMPFPEVIETDYTRFGLFDNFFRDEKYEPGWEPVFQTFTIPVDAFTDGDTSFEMNDLEKLTLHFTSPSGNIYIEEIGVR